MFNRKLIGATALFISVMCLTSHANEAERIPTIDNIFKHETYKVSGTVPAEKLNGKYALVLNYINKHSAHYLISDVNTLPKAHKTQVLCLALNMYQEARGSTEDDQRAVAYVTVNRAIGDNHYKETLCGVVWQHAQFSWTTKSVNEILPKEAEAWAKVQQDALNIYKEKQANVITHFDITNGATHFYAPELMDEPAWAYKASNKEQIGGHIYMTMNNI